jgi:prepilin-type N-terminal cleavage/methylation domain-containing protein
MRGHRDGEAAPASSTNTSGRRRIRCGPLEGDRSDEGFTLIELLVVVVILPIIVGSIAVALISVFGLQTQTSSSLTASGDAQVASANFVGDIQSASWVSTNAADMCTSTGTPLLAITSDATNPGAATTWSAINAPFVVSYAVVPEGKTNSLFRFVCSGGSAVPKFSTVISHNVPACVSPLCVKISPSGASLAAAAGWVMASSISAVNLLIAEPSSNYTDNLTAVPRVWNPSSGGQPNPNTPILPFELIPPPGGGCTNPPLTMAGNTTITVGGGTGFMGVASACTPSVVLGPKGSATLSASLFTTTSPASHAVSLSSGSNGPGSETTVANLQNPFSGLAAPSYPSTSGLGGGACGTTTCSTGLYGAQTYSGNTPLTFDPTTSPSPNVIVFTGPVNITNAANVTFGGGSSVSQVTYWFEGGLSLSGNSTAKFGLATYIFGTPTTSNATTALSVTNGATLSANNSLLFYVAGPAPAANCSGAGGGGAVNFSGGTNTGISGTSTYDGIALWDASTGPLTLGAGSTVGAPIGGIYDPCGSVIYSGGTGMAVLFLVAQSVSAPTGSATLNILG